MDNGQTNSNFEQSFLSGVNYAPETGSKDKKKLFIIIGAVVGVVALVLLIVSLIVTNKNNTDKDEKNLASALSIYCRVEDEIFYLNDSYEYIREPFDIEDSLVKVEDGLYKQVGAGAETGIYTFDGKTIHFVSQDGEDYYVDYSSYVFTMDGEMYRCEEYDYE